MLRFHLESSIQASQVDLSSYHLAPGALERLIPPWEAISLVSKTDGPLTNESEVTLKVPLFPGIYQKWLAKHRDVNPPSGFVDYQESGPFAKWIHTHSFQKETESSSTLSDTIEYQLPLAPLSHIVSSWFVNWKLSATFKFRHQRTKNDLERIAELNPYKKKTVLITGASGLVGKELKAFLDVSGHTTLTLSRKAPSNENEYQWDIAQRSFPLEALERADAVIHLAGENIAGARWSDKQKKKILDSRILSTQLIIDSMRELSDRPATFISASANGFYGSRGDEILTEESSKGEGLFITEVAEQWEASTRNAEDLGVRTVLPRIGIVLSPKGGALQKMLPAFAFGVAGRLGTGNQWMSWIAIDDLVYGLAYALQNESWSGPFNFVAPNPVTNAQFTQTLARVLSRPAIIPAPAFALRLALGEIADELLLSSIRCQPERLLKNDFTFSFSDLESTLRFLLGR